VRVDNEKMSKSLGNFFTIREVMERYDPEVIRLFILSSHYRSPLNYSDQHLDGAKAALGSLYNALRGLEPTGISVQEGAYSERFLQAMDDDFATPDAMAVLFEMAHEIHRQRASAPEQAQALAAEMRHLAGLLGLLQQEPEAYFKAGTPAGGLADEAIDDLIAQRLQARQDKNWAESDRIRDLLKEQGVVLEDGPQGTSWRRA
jgi:cysteinyl-tRNA synthetase